MGEGETLLKALRHKGLKKNSVSVHFFVAYSVQMRMMTLIPLPLGAMDFLAYDPPREG